MNKRVNQTEPCRNQLNYVGHPIQHSSCLIVSVLQSHVYADRQTITVKLSTINTINGFNEMLLLCGLFWTVSWVEFFFTEIQILLLFFFSSFVIFHQDGFSVIQPLTHSFIRSFIHSVINVNECDFVFWFGVIILISQLLIMTHPCPLTNTIKLFQCVW